MASTQQAARRPEVDMADPVSLLLSNLVKSQHKHHQEQQATQQGPHPLASTFESKKPAAVKLDLYLVRLAQYSGCSVQSIVSTLVYIDRVVEINPAFMVSEANIHRLVLACIVVSMKFWDDHFYTNNFYARVGGVPLEELNLLEVALLSLLQFELYISSCVYEQYERALASAHIYCKRHKESLANQDAKPPAAAAPTPMLFAQPAANKEKQELLVWYPSTTCSFVSEISVAASNGPAPVQFA